MDDRAVLIVLTMVCVYALQSIWTFRVKRPTSIRLAYLLLFTIMMGFLTYVALDFSGIFQ